MCSDNYTLNCMRYDSHYRVKPRCRFIDQDKQMIMMQLKPCSYFLRMRNELSHHNSLRIILCLLTCAELLQKWPRDAKSCLAFTIVGSMNLDLRYYMYVCKVNIKQKQHIQHARQWYNTNIYTERCKQVFMSIMGSST